MLRRPAQTAKNARFPLGAYNLCTLLTGESMVFIDPGISESYITNELVESCLEDGNTP
jgi:hypothetical protein